VAIFHIFKDLTNHKKVLNNVHSMDMAAKRDLRGEP
jgi:hypothetical protein